MRASVVFPIAMRFTCGNVRKKLVSQSREFRKMEVKRQNSVYPSKIYPRLDSVDLKDEADENFQALNDIDFENHTEAFRNKTTWEIVRALTVLRLCSVDKLVDNSLELMRWTRRVCGRKVLRALYKPTFYDQFVGGENSKEIQACVRRLAECGMRAMLATTMEEDIGEGGNDEVYDNNCKRILESIEIATAEDTPSPMIQLKLSGLLPADFLVILGNIYTGSTDKPKLVKAIAQGLTGNGICMSFLTDILSDEKKITTLEKAVERLKKIGQEAQHRGVKVLVDAEYTYLNPGLSLLTLATIAAYNQKSPVIWNTYQCYLKNAYQKVQEELILITRDLDAYFGAKVVRGAYMMTERSRAQKLHIPDPVCKDYAETSHNYDSVVSFLLEQTSNVGSRCHFIIASHNETSIKSAIKKMMELNIDKQRGDICFGQLYGMCDQVTNPLAKSGYSVYKSIPYGTLDEVLPYLARRAVENKTVLEGARKEHTLLFKELKQRLWRKIRCQSLPANNPMASER